MAVESQGGHGRYLAALRSSTVQKALENKEIPTPFLGSCIEAGIVDVHDETLLFELEKSVGKRLKPAVQPTMNIGNAQSQEKAPSTRVFSTTGMPVVKTDSDKMPFERGLCGQEMFRKTVAEMDEKLAEDITLKHKNFVKSALYNARKDWCSPDLMRALVMDDRYVDKLKAAMYPLTVSYCERNFTDGGKTYRVPYITILDDFESDGSYMLRKGEKEADYEYEGRYQISTTYYLNNKGGIGSMTSSTIHLYDIKDFTSPEAVGNYLKELERAFDKKCKKKVNAADRKRFIREDWGTIKAFLEPYATGKKPIGNPMELMKDFAHEHRMVYGGDTENEFLNLRTGESFYATIRNNVKEIRKYGPDWYKVLDVTNCMRGEVFDRRLVAAEFDRQKPGSAARIRAVADESLRRLSRKLLNTEGIGVGDNPMYEPEGEDEYYKYDYSI